MRTAIAIFATLGLLATLSPAQPLWSDNFQDGNYTANPPWFHYGGVTQMSQFGGDWCLEVYYATPPVDSSGVIFTGLPEVQEFTLEFDLHKRWTSGWQNNVRIGLTEGPFTPGVGFEFMENDENNLQLRWNGTTVSQVPIPGFQYAWIHVVMHRFPCGNWQITWDQGGPHQTTISGQDQFGTLTNPHLYLECDGWYSQQRGAYFDDFVMNAPSQSWPLIYEEDFSSDPGWVTNNPARFHWNPADQNYYGELVNWAQEYGVYPLSQDIEGSFKIEYDTKLIQVQWGSGFDFGIFSDTIGYLQPSTLNLEFDNPDPGPQFDAWWYTPQGGGTFGSPTDWQLNVWYHVVLMYNAETQIVSFQATQNGMPIASSSTQIIGQYEGLRNIGLSRRWSWPPQGQTAKGYVDNVRLYAPLAGYPGEFVVDDHTAALWHFNENAGTIAHDATAHNYDMTLQDGAGWHAPGWNNTPSAVDLTDPDGKVNSNYTIGNGWGAITLEAWIYPTQIGPATGWFDGHPIITRQEFHNVSDCSYYLYLTALGEIYAGVNLNEPGGAYSQALTEQNLIQVNTWYHVVATWSSGEPLRIFVNDMNDPVAISPQVETGAIRTGTDALRIGCNWTIEYYNEWEYFHGYIDEVRISDVVRYGTPPPPPGGPVQIALMPLNPPILIPPNGGSFSFNVTIANNSTTVQFCDVWSYLQLPPPGGSVPSLGPIALTLPPNSSMTRLRSQSVPANAPPGNYLYCGYVGDYPWNVINTDNFPFAKTGREGSGDGLEGWLCTGEPFPGEISAADDLLNDFALHQAFPNPFNATTAISYELRAASYVKLAVFDVSGRTVATVVDGWREAGEHQVTFDGSGLSSGIYFAKLEAGSDGQVQKIVLMK